MSDRCWTEDEERMLRDPADDFSPIEELLIARKRLRAAINQEALERSVDAILTRHFRERLGLGPLEPASPDRLPE